MREQLSISERESTADGGAFSFLVVKVHKKIQFIHSAQLLYGMQFGSFRRNLAVLLVLYGVCHV